MNVIDFLKFDVAEKKCDDVRKDFEDRRRAVGTYDIILTQYWKDEESRLSTEEGHTKNRALRSNSLTSDSRASPFHAEILKELEQQIRQVKHHMTKLMQRKRGDFSDTERWNAEVQEVYEMYKAIEPKQVDHYIRWQYEEEKRRSHPFQYWALLKASVWYVCISQYGVPFPDWAWFVAGRELCNLKTLQSGNVKVMAGHMHDILRVDTKYTKRLLESRVAENDVLIEDVDGALADDDDDTVALE